MRFTAVLMRKVKKEIGEVSKRYGNFPDSYIARSMEQVHWQTPKGKPQYLNKTVERRSWRFTTNRPWTAQFYQQNLPGSKRRKVFVEPLGKNLKDRCKEAPASDPFINILIVVTSLSHLYSFQKAGFSTAEIELKCLWAEIKESKDMSLKSFKRETGSSLKA